MPKRRRPLHRYQSFCTALVTAVMLAALAGSSRTASAAGGGAGSTATLSESDGKTLLDPSFGFILDLPDGFIPAPDVMARKPALLHAYALGRRDSNGVSITLMIERLGGTIGRERLQRRHIPRNVVGELLTARWGEFDLDGFIVQEKVGHRTYLTYNVKVPLKREAIQLKLVGPATRKDELDAIMRQLLDGLEGESNWSVSDPVAAATATRGSSGGGGSASDTFGVSPRVFMIGVAAVGAVALVPLFWPRPRRVSDMPMRNTRSSSSSSSSSQPPPLPPHLTSGATPPPLPPRTPPF